MEYINENLIENFLNFLSRRKLQLSDRKYYNNSSYYSYLEDFLKTFIENVSYDGCKEEVEKSLLYKYFKDYNCVAEFENFKIGLKYIDEETCEVSDEKILVDCIVSNIYQDFNDSIENYLDTIFCLKQILLKYDCLTKAIEILENIE